MKSWVFCAALVAACGGDDNQATPDAGPRPDAAPTCPTPATPLADGMHTLYLSFNGVTIMLGECDDAKTNCSSLVTQGSTNIAAFADQGSVTVIAGMVQEALAPFSVDVVTTRPTSGNYRMVSIGGMASQVTATDGLVAAKPVCDGANENGIAFITQQDIEFTNRGYADLIAGAFGRLAGLVPSTRSGDCMCTQATCAHLQACTFGTNSVTQTGNACDRTSQNEQQLLMDAVGCR